MNRIASRTLTLSHLRYGVTKTITQKAAEGAAKPVAGKYVSVHYTGKLQNGEVFDCSRTRGEPIKFQLGVGQVNIWFLFF